MAVSAKYETIQIDGILPLANKMQSKGCRFVQLLAVNTESGIDVQYTFMNENALENYTVQGVKETDEIPSITGQFIAAFVFENEIHDLFGVNVKDIAIDFKGNFYALTQQKPMTIISPEQKAAREKAAKIAAAKAAKLAKAKKAAQAKKESAEETSENKPTKESEGE